MTFRPASVTATVGIARASVIIVYIMVLAALLMALSRPAGSAACDETDQ